MTNDRGVSFFSPGRRVGCLALFFSLSAGTAAILIQIPRTDNSTIRIIAPQRNATMSGKKPKKTAGNVIAVNRKARHDYFIEDTLEAGLVLEGWEVKSLRAGNAQLKEGYVTIRNGEAWLVGAHLSPLRTASTHVKPDPTRSRKLLLHRGELDRRPPRLDLRFRPPGIRSTIFVPPWRYAGFRSIRRR